MPEIGLPYAPADVDEHGYHVTCPVTGCGEKFYAVTPGPCCAGYQRTEGPRGVVESHSFGCPMLEGAPKTFDDPSSARDRFFGCSDAEVAKWDEDEATKDPVALYGTHYVMRHGQS